MTAGMRWAFRNHLGPVPAEAGSYTVTFTRQRLSGSNGWSFEIRNAAGVYRGGGWSAGNKADAEFDAAMRLRDICRPLATEAA